MGSNEPFLLVHCLDFFVVAIWLGVQRFKKQLDFAFLTKLCLQNPISHICISVLATSCKYLGKAMGFKYSKTCLFLFAHIAVSSIWIYDTNTQQPMREAFLYTSVDSSSCNRRYFIFAAFESSGKVFHIEINDLIIEYIEPITMCDGMTIFEITPLKSVIDYIQHAPYLFTHLDTYDFPIHVEDLFNHPPSLFKYGFLVALYSPAAQSYISGFKIFQILSHIERNFSLLPPVCSQAKTQDSHQPNASREETQHTKPERKSLSNKKNREISELASLSMLPRKTIRKERWSRNQWTKLTEELFEKMLQHEKTNPSIKQSEMQKLFNVNRSTYWRWKKKYNLL